MIWGKTHIQDVEEYFRIHLWFAWRPVRLKDGRWIWLQKVLRERTDTRDAGICTEYTLGE